MLILLRWITFPSVEGMSAGASFGLFLGLILAITSAAGAFLTHKQAPAAQTP